MPNPESLRRELTEEEEMMTVASGPLRKNPEPRVVANIESIRIPERARELMHRLGTLVPDERVNLESQLENAHEIQREPVSANRGYYTPVSGVENIPYIAGTKVTVELPSGKQMRVMEKSEEILDKQSREHTNIDLAAYHGMDNKEGLRREWLAYVVDRVFRLNMIPVTILKYGKEGLASQQEWKENIISNKDITETEDWYDIPANNTQLQRLALTQALVKNVDAHNENVLTQSLNEAGLPKEMSQSDNAMALASATNKMPIKSFAWESMQGAMIQEDLMVKHIDPFFEHPELQEILHEAFRVALDEKHAENDWVEFMARVEKIGNTGIFPKDDRLKKQRKPDDGSPEIWSLDKDKAV